MKFTLGIFKIIPAQVKIKMDFVNFYGAQRQFKIV
jgi:hypothetical protein